MTRTMLSLVLSLVFLATLGTLAEPAVAQVRGGGVAVTAGTGHRNWHGGGTGHRHWHGGRGGRVGFGISFAAPIYYGSYYGSYGSYYGPGYGTYYAPGYAYGSGTLLVAPPPVVYESGPVPAAAPMTQPEPIIYPRNGQSAARIESDRRDCNRWAIGQPDAMGDATVFHRATLACMEGRGYTVR